MENRIELIEHFRNGRLIDAIKQEIPAHDMSSGYGRFVKMSDGHDDHFRTTTIFPHGELYYNHYHIFHTPKCVIIFLVPTWQNTFCTGRLWVKYSGMEDFMLLGEINDDYAPGIIIGPQFDDFMRNQWFETKPDGKMVEYVVNGLGIPEVKV